MFNKLEEIIKNTKGNVLSVCLDSKLTDLLIKNKNINLYTIDTPISNKIGGLIKNKNKRKTNKGKYINIKKLRKHIKKKTVDYMFCNMNEMYDYYKYFIKDSVYLNRGKLYIYINKELDKDLLIKNYKRYTKNIEFDEYKNGFIIIINNTDTKNNLIKDIIYFIKDSFYNLAEAIGNLLIS